MDERAGCYISGRLLRVKGWALRKGARLEQRSAEVKDGEEPREGFGMGKVQRGQSHAFGSFLPLCTKNELTPGLLMAAQSV